MNINRNPLVSVVMPVYNRRRFLPQAIDSILIQTFVNFEFIIVDDCSTDGSKEIITQYSQTDSRILMINNSTNLGVATTRNIGHLAAKGEFVAIMDSDDIALPDRLEKQLKYLEQNPEVGLCGSWIEYIGENDRKLKTWRTPLTDGEIRCEMLFAMCIANPSVMFRRALITDHLLMIDPEFKVAEDYEYWSRVLDFTKAGNIGEVLLRYRIHPEQLSLRNHHELNKTISFVHRRFLSKMGIDCSEEELSIHKAVSMYEHSDGTDLIPQVAYWLKKLITANNKSMVFPEATFQKEISGRWAFYLLINKINKKNLAVVLSSPLKPASIYSKFKIIFILKWILYRLKKDIFK